MHDSKAPVISVHFSGGGALPGSSPAKKRRAFSPWMPKVCRTLRSLVELSAPSLGITQEGKCFSAPHPSFSSCVFEAAGGGLFGCPE